ncbi:MAG: hypothetical protein PQJ60_08085, partial [Spirochaetales bacterium]|nr:hypothetical protein [Spirochaetales bacterium]
MKEEEITDYNFAPYRPEQRGFVLFRRIILGILLLHTLFALFHSPPFWPLYVSAAMTGLFALLLLPYGGKAPKTPVLPAYLINLYPFITLILLNVFEERLCLNQYYNEIGLSLVLLSAFQFLNRKQIFRRLLLITLCGWILALFDMALMHSYFGIEINLNPHNNLWDHFLSFLFLSLSIGLSAYLSFLNLQYRLSENRQKEKDEVFMELITRGDHQGLCLMDIKNDTLLANSAFFRMMKRDVNHSVNSLSKMVGELIYREDMSLAREILNDLNRGRTERLPVDFRLNYDNTYKWLRLDGAFYQAERENLFLGILTDISDVKRQAHRIDQAFRASGFVPWRWDRSKGTADFDEKYTYLMGVPLARYSLTQRDFFHRII